MLLVEDTRQQTGKHEAKHKTFSEMGVEVLRSKLAFGDYCLPPTVAVDTKASIMEIAGNLCGSQKETARVREEMKLARACGAVLIFLIEVGKYKTPADLIGESFRLKSGKVVEGIQLYRAMETCAARYGCRFEFCPPSEAGRRVLELLRGDKDGK